MNSAVPQPDPAAIAETDRILFLLSRQFDDDLTREETTELAEPLNRDSDLKCRAAFANLRDMFQALPVKPVARSFAADVHNAIRNQSLKVPADPLPHQSRGWMARGIVAVSVASSAAVLLLMTKTYDSRPSANQIARTSDRIATPAAEMAKTMSSEIAVASADEEAAAQEATARQEELRPFLETDDWRIVVVKVNSKDRKEVMHDIEALVAENGMDIRQVAGNNDHDPRFGILFTSAGVDDKALVENVLSQTDAQSADWNAQSVAESTRESVIRRVQESMKIPTHSEMHFGQVYVTLPKASSLPAANVNVAMADQPVVAKNSAIAESSIPSESAERTIEPSGTVDALTSASKVPVLVVFEFASEEADRI